MEFNLGGNGGARSGGNDVELFSKTLQVEHKLFYFDLKENPRGRYLKISEKISATRFTIIIPFNGISWFFDIFNYYIPSDDQDISSKELQLDSKAIYYITHYTYYTYAFIFITLQNGSFFRCFTLTLGKTGGVGFSIREVGSKVAAVEQIQETPLGIKSTSCENLFFFNLFNHHFVIILFCI
uniref:Uncharacterized protein n=1 Tax=Lactuca sativa TaxID=4236 RepID=A0A9R1WVZ5_LACSA|nr:hypothetical protein LSAT_V11C800427630 [Lactuca sativa]